MSKSAESVQKIAQFRNEYMEFDGISASLWARGSDHIQLFLDTKSEMEELAKELGVPCFVKTHSKNNDWAFFIYEGNEFGSLIAKESENKEEENNG